MPTKEEKPQKAAPETIQNRTFYKNNPVIVLLIVLVGALIFMAGLAVDRHQPGRVFSVSTGSKPMFMRQGSFSAVSGGAGGPMAVEHGMVNTSDSQDRLNGVVTAVNGTSFTVAGHGATNQVATSSSTQYTNGDQVKVNDSVIVSGTRSNGSLQASQIVINP